MIQRIQDLPEAVLGFRASGTVTDQDYEAVIIPAVDHALERSGKVRLLYHLPPDFEGFDPHALWDDAKIGLKHLTSWDRIALVTDIGWLRRTTKALGFVMPGEVRVYENEAFDEAREWISA